MTNADYMKNRAGIDIDCPNIRESRQGYFDFWKKNLDVCYAVSAGLSTIGPLEKQTSSKAAKWISEAKNIYILGYGFDPVNNKNIGLGHIRGKNVSFTNFDNKNKVNKIVGSLLVEQPGYFMKEHYLQSPIQVTKPFFYEKSVKNVYEALSNDFDLSG